MQEKLFVTGRGFFHSGRTGGEASAAKMLCTVLMEKTSRKSYNFGDKQAIFIHVRKNTQEIHRKYSENCPCIDEVN